MAAPQMFAVLLPDVHRHDHSGSLSLSSAKDPSTMSQAPSPMIKLLFPCSRVPLPMVQAPLLMLKISFTIYEVSIAFVKTKVIKRGQRGKRGQQRTFRREEKTPQHSNQAKSMS